MLFSLADLYFAGRLAVEEQSCVSCHRASDAAPLSKSLARRPGPHLTQAGDRLQEAWVYHWLGDPQQFRPEAVMPRLFAEDRQGEVERRAVARYLAQQKPLRLRNVVESQADREKLAAEGKSYSSALAALPAITRLPAGRPGRRLRGLGQKTTARMFGRVFYSSHPNSIRLAACPI